MFVYDRISVNLIADEITPQVEVVQGDTGRGLLIDIGTTFTNPKAYAYVDKADGHKVFNNCSISGSIVTVEYSAQMLAAAGMNYLQIMITENLQRVTTFDIPVLVKKSRVDNSAIESTDEYRALEELIASVAPAVQAANAATTAANNAANNANTKATAANNAANNANEKAAEAAQNAQIALEQANAAGTAANNANQQADRAIAAAAGANAAADEAEAAARLVENLNPRSIITATNSAQLRIETNATYVKVPLQTQHAKAGEKLTIDSEGNIVVGAGVTKILVCATVEIFSTNTDKINLRIIKNNDTVGNTLAWTVQPIAAGGSAPVSICNILSNVTTGDKIAIWVWGASGNTIIISGGDTNSLDLRTFLTVETIA